MTGPQNVPPGYELDQVAPGYEVPVRVVNRHPRGGNPAVDGAYMAELGASFGALGATQGVMTALMQDLHTATMNANLAIVPIVGKRVQELFRARLNQILQAVNSMQGVQVQPAPGILARLAGPLPQTNGPAYIDKQAVLNLIATAMAELPGGV